MEEESRIFDSSPTFVEIGGKICTFRVAQHISFHYRNRKVAVL